MTMKRSSYWPLPKTSPARVGLCAQRLERASAYLERLIADRALAGAITLVARRGHIAHLCCQGQQDVEHGVAMREDALFRIYSMTKPIVAVATLMLYEELALGLQDPVKRFLPEFANLKVAVTGLKGKTRKVLPKRDITLHDLLTHTGGLSYALALEYGKKGKNLAAFIKEFCQEPLLGHPGEQWRYSSSNDVLGRVIEVISGQSLDVFLENRIFRPLGMRDTGFFVPPAKHHRLAALYQHDPQTRIVPYGAEDQPYLEKPAFLSGGAGLVSSTADYLRFCLMLLGGGALNGVRILSPKTVELMRQDHLPPGHPAIEPYKFGYGYGVSVLRSLTEKQGIGSVGEFGWGGAAGTNVWIDPQEDMVCLVMFQLRNPVIPMIDHRTKVALTASIID
jgi:CubicO group peptidase (beta-lactamase class C family)